MIKKKDAQEILKIKNKLRGIPKPLFDFIKRNSGEEELKKIEKKSQELNIPFSLKYSSQKKIYTLGEVLLFLVIVEEVLGWDDKKFEEMGRVWGKGAAVIKLFSYLFRPNKSFFFKVLPKIGNRFLGNMEVVPLEIDFQKKKIAKFEIKGVELEKNKKSPLVEKALRLGMAFFGGFLASFAQMVLGIEESRLETKIENDGFLFLIKW